MDPHPYLALEATAAFFLLLAYVFTSFLDNALSRLTRVDVKLLEDRTEGRTDFLLEELSRGKNRVTIPLQFLHHLLLVGLALLCHDILAGLGVSLPALGALLLAGLFSLLLHHLLPWVAAPADAGTAFSRLLPAFRPVYPPLRLLCLPILSLVSRRRGLEKEEGTSEETITEEEIQAFLDVGEEEGIFEEEETRIIQQLVEFGETLVREVMVPRTDMAALPMTATREEMREYMVETRHSRIPVYRDTVDDIVGMVHVRRLLGGYSSETEDQGLEDLVQPMPVVPESKKVAELLREMQTRHEHIALVVDEYGGTAGLVTLEDLLEEIVGEIQDEDQTEETGIRQLAPDVFLVDGDTELGDLEQHLGQELDAEGCTTAAGLVIRHLGRLPTKGEKLRIGSLHIRVTRADDRKIQELRIRRDHDLA